MKNIIATCFLFICVNVFGSGTTTNYVGKLTVTAEGKTTEYDQKTVEVTVDGDHVTLKIAAFGFGSYSGMTINLGCTKNVSTLSTPLTLSITPKLIAALLGTLTPALNSGSLTDTNCNLDLSIHSSKLPDDIHVTFSGTK